MPRYFFDLLTDKSHDKDEIGAEFDTLEEVRHQAMCALPAIAADEVPNAGDRQTFTVLVTDEQGHSIYTATLNFAGLWLRRDEPVS